METPGSFESGPQLRECLKRYQPENRVALVAVYNSIIGATLSQPVTSFMQKPRKIVIIGGCGHVGLPLGIVFANCGLDVVLLDRDQAKINLVNKGQMPFMETNAAGIDVRV